MKIVLAAAILLATAAPASAHQTEVTQKQMRWKRAGLIEWNREVARRERQRLAAIEAAEVESAEPDATQAAPTFNPGALSAEQIASYLRGAGFPESVISTMVSIIYRESGGCPTAVYGYGCAGGGHAYAGGP